jgi:6-phosphogluconate dehydrogenase
MSVFGDPQGVTAGMNSLAGKHPACPSNQWSVEESDMQLGMIGLGRMGANMVRRLLRGCHECVVFDRSPKPVEELVQERAVGAADLKDLEDVLIDGGNPYYVDDIRRAKELAPKGVHYVDVGTSGGVWGLERGYCMVIGGEPEVVNRLDPIFKQLAPGRGDIPRTPGREELDGTAELGYLHCGPNGAGHFVKMVQNGIEYGLMAAYAEGLGILRQANIGRSTPRPRPCASPNSIRTS